MIIAITSTGNKLNSNIDSRFGRTKFIIIYNTEKFNFKAHNNNLNLNQTAQNIIEYGADILITGNCGPKAFKVLKTGNINIFSSPISTVEDAIKAYIDNKLEELDNSNIEGH